jgi:hypothetical protein
LFENRVRVCKDETPFFRYSSAFDTANFSKLNEIIHIVVKRVII